MRVVMLILILVLLVATATATENQQRSVQVQRGRTIFQQYCSTCHGMDGKGANGTRGIADSKVIVGPVPTLLSILVYGKSGNAERTNGIKPAMPPIPYSPADMASVATYVLQEFGKRTEQINEADVLKVKYKNGTSR